MVDLLQKYCRGHSLCATRYLLLFLQIIDLVIKNIHTQIYFIRTVYWKEKKVTFSLTHFLCFKLRILFNVNMLHDAAHTNFRIIYNS
jgi:hypothetical protein